MSNMQTQHCPVPAQSQCTQGRSYYRALEELFGTCNCGLHIVAKCYNVYVIIFMRNTEYSVHSICEHTIGVLAKSTPTMERPSSAL